VDFACLGKISARLKIANSMQKTPLCEAALLNLMNN
jgi:hypothetical protein